MSPQRGDIGEETGDFFSYVGHAIVAVGGAGRYSFVPAFPAPQRVAAHNMAQALREDEELLLLS